METHPFLEAAAERVLLADGAMGTLLHARGVPTEASFDGLNLTRRDLIERVHLDYLQAGADVLQTNTFGANRLRLAGYGLADKVWEVNVWGAKLARSAREIAGEPAFVAGSMGPTGKALHPLGSLRPETARAAFREQAEGLLAGGVDLFILETFSDVRELAEAVAAIRELCRLPIVAQLSFSAEGQTFMGVTPQAAAEALAALGELRPEGVGLNCGAGPAPVLEALAAMAGALSYPALLAAQPNAGLPARVGGRFFYEASPRYLAGFVPRFVQAGARLVGGCCGTTPEHIAAMRAALAGLQAPSPGQDGQAAGTALSFPPGAAAGPARPGGEEGLRPAGGDDDLPACARSGGQGEPFSERLGKTFVVSVELDPPRGVVARKYLRGARLLQEAGVDALNVADSPMARVRMSCLAGAHLIQAYTGLETIIHFTTRDRNLMGIQADLLGAHALGIRHILALTGDPPGLGNYAHATAVYDVDSIGLLRILRELNQGRDIAGNSIGRPTCFTAACALTPCAQDLETELRRLREKLDAGARFVMTQPLYELAPLYRVLERLGGCPVPVLVGIMPLHSYKHAEYLHNEVPGIEIPAAAREELRKAGDEGERVGLEQAWRLVAEARGVAAGVYIVPSFGKYEGVAALVRRIKAATAPARPAPGPGLRNAR